MINQQQVGGQRVLIALAIHPLHSFELAAHLPYLGDLPDHHLDSTAVPKLLQLFELCRLGIEGIAAVHQIGFAGIGAIFSCALQRCAHGFFIAAIDQRCAAMCHIQLTGVIKELSISQGFHTRGFQSLGHKSAHASSNKDGASMKHRASRGASLPAAIGHGLQRLHLLRQMTGHGHGCNLLVQQLHQLLACADWNAGNVVDGLVGVELAALAADMGQGIDQMGLNALQA